MEKKFGFPLLRFLSENKGLFAGAHPLDFTTKSTKDTKDEI